MWYCSCFEQLVTECTQQPKAVRRCMFVQVFDHVVVATGFFNTPRAPTLAGLDSFTGTVMHSTDFRTAEPLRGTKHQLHHGSFVSHHVACSVM